MGRRAGAITVSLDVWHLDIPEFLEMQTETGDVRRKAYDIFPQIVVPNEFMRRVLTQDEWTLFDPYEIRRKFGIELAEIWGERFTLTYKDLESKLDTEITLYKKVNARDLFKSIMRSQIETGMPFLFFKDTANQANPNQHQGYIPGANLCVAPETRILTDKGYFPIRDLENEKVRVWNGSEWSEVTVQKTGVDQPLLKVNLSNGETLECTYYHHFYVKDTLARKPRRVEAKDLRPGDKLIKYSLPITDSISDVEFDYAYISGFFSADVSHSGEGHSEIDLYGQKKALLPKLTISSHSKELNSSAVCVDVKQDRIIPDISQKFTVPLNGYTVKSRLEWLAGLLDSEGKILREDDNESIMIPSIYKTFLLEIRLMLQTLGINSKVLKARREGQSKLCQTVYQLTILPNALLHLKQLGLKTHQLKWKPRRSQEVTSFTQVTSVELTCRRDDTFCFTEPLRNMGMFNGILTGQCTESWNVVKAGTEDHVCNLTSVNLANIHSTDELEVACRTSVRIIDNSIYLTHPPTEGSKKHNSLYRTAGVGVMGLADWLARNKLRYTDTGIIDTLFEDISFFCTDASADLAVERGAYPAFEGSSWSQGHLLGNKSLADIVLRASLKSRWLDLQLKILDTGVRNSQVMAIAPNTSSALLQGCTAGILPPYGKFVYDKSKGVVPIAPPEIETRFWFYNENKTLDQQIVVDAVAVMQFWVDTGISMELNFNLNAGVYYPDEPERSIQAVDIFNILISAWEQGCKAIYYVRTVQRDSFKEGCASCAN